jgi:excisionase family DNA binding protein
LDLTSPTTEPAALLRVEDAARLLNIGRSTTYDLIRTRRLRSVKIGRRRLVPRDAITETIAALAEDATL